MHVLARDSVFFYIKKIAFWGGGFETAEKDLLYKYISIFSWRKYLLEVTDLDNKIL